MVKEINNPPRYVKSIKPETSTELLLCAILSARGQDQQWISVTFRGHLHTLTYLESLAGAGLGPQAPR